MRLVARGGVLVQMEIQRYGPEVPDGSAHELRKPALLRAFTAWNQAPGGLKWRSTIVSTVPEAQLFDLGIDFGLISAKELSRFLQGRPAAHQRFQVQEVRRRPRSFSKDRAGHGGGNLGPSATSAAASRRSREVRPAPHGEVVRPQAAAVQMVNFPAAQIPSASS